MIPTVARADAGGVKLSVLTVAPGREIFQLEGHTALRIVRDGSDGMPAFDNVVNWGVFDFNSPNFVGRFVKGDTDYMALAYPTELFLEEYRREGRQVVEQVIDVSSSQASAICAAVAENLRPEHRTYRYNYVLDNCATRPMELLARYADTSGADAFGGIEPGASTFRSEMRRYHKNYPWYQFGIDLALGRGIDAPVSQRACNFAPVQFRKSLAEAKRSDGTPLVSSTDVLVPGSENGIAAGPTPWPLTPLAVGIYALIATIIVSLRDVRRRRIARWFDTLLLGTFGLLGLLLTFLIFCSSHYGASPNLLYLWLNPVCLMAAAAVWIKSCRRVVYYYQICNFVAVVLLLVAFGAGAQAMNVAFLPLMLSDMVRSAVYVYLRK